MNESLRFYLSEVEMNKPGATDVALYQLELQAGFKLPLDYKELMKMFNGGEGEVGENG